MMDLQANVKGIKVLVLGDCMIDRYIWGKVDRISPEAPVPVLHWELDENRLGGAANVALNARQFGIEVALCGICGDDDNADLLMDLCEEAGINNSFLLRSASRPTTVKTRILSGQQHMLRVDRESTEALSENEFDHLVTKWDYAIQEMRPDILIIQDYNKGLLTSRLIRHVLDAARANNIFVAVDPKKDNFSLYQKVDLFKPNLKESRQALQHDFKVDPVSLDKAADELHKILAAKNLMVTLSEHGIYYRNNSGESGLSPTLKRSIVDVCGAGDAVLTVAALALYSGMSISDTADLCNIAGGQVCGTVGVSTLDVKRLMDEANGSGNPE